MDHTIVWSIITVRRMLHVRVGTIGRRSVYFCEESIYFAQLTWRPNCPDPTTDAEIAGVGSVSSMEVHGTAMRILDDGR